MLSELLATPGVVEGVVFRSRIGVLALHGGLEAATEVAAHRCADIAAASFYAVVQPPDLRFHVPSTKFDPRHSRKLSAFLEHALIAVSFHGFGRKGLEETGVVGGSNKRMRQMIAAAVADQTDLNAVAKDPDIPAGLEGVHPRNPVNMPLWGGVQIEMSSRARHPGPLESLVNAVAGVLVDEQPGVSAP
jgi:phage replication-related protein YjqB (UPF0714/DUF867 family)